MTKAHGRVQRYRCRYCDRTVSDQTESLHVYAKRRVPLQAITESLLSGSSLRDAARRYNVSPMAIQNAVLRLGRQAMAAHILLTTRFPDADRLCVDGFRSFVTTQDFPCDITATVDGQGEAILTMVHTVTRRGGRTTSMQKRRMTARYSKWRPKKGSMRTTISLLLREMWNWLNPTWPDPSLIDTDEHPLYRSIISSDPVAHHFRAAGLFRHRRTISTAARTTMNPLFPVNYIDRLLRHRMKEHTRETIAFGRHATMQMHRAWLFAWDHNYRRRWRVRGSLDQVHAEVSGVDAESITKVNRQFFRRRIIPDRVDVPHSIRDVWLNRIQTPPLRWRLGQKGSSIRIPAYAVRDLGHYDQHASGYY